MGAGARSELSTPAGNCGAWVRSAADSPENRFLQCTCYCECRLCHGTEHFGLLRSLAGICRLRRSDVSFGDQPLISSSVIDSLIDAYEREKAPITVPVYHGKRGNPVIIDRSLFPALETLT
ncbi:hypothetical protein D4S03_12435, partial [bacterium]